MSKPKCTFLTVQIASSFELSVGSDYPRLFSDLWFKTAGNSLESQQNCNNSNASCFFVGWFSARRSHEHSNWLSRVTCHKLSSSDLWTTPWMRRSDRKWRVEIPGAREPKCLTRLPWLYPRRARKKNPLNFCGLGFWTKHHEKVEPRLGYEMRGSSVHCSEGPSWSQRGGDSILAES